MQRPGLERDVVDAGVYERTVRRFPEAGIVMPTFAQLADPATVDPAPIDGARAASIPTPPTRSTSSASTGTTAADRRARIAASRARRAAVVADRRGRPDRRRPRRPLPDDRRAQGPRRLRLPRPADRDRPVRPDHAPRGLAVDRQLLPRRRRDLADHGLPRRGRPARGHEPGAVRLARALGRRPGRHHPDAGLGEQRQGDLRPLRGARAATRATSSSTSSPSSGTTSSTTSSPAGRSGASSSRCRRSSRTCALRAFVSATGSAGTIGAGDYLKERFGARIVAVEAARVPDDARERLRRAQHPGHRRQAHPAHPQRDEHGHGRRHLGPGDRPAQRPVRHRRRPRLPRPAGAACPAAIVDALDSFGLSSICNVLAAIKVARHDRLGPDDVVVTVATDGAAMYRTERDKVLARDFAGGFDEVGGRRDVRPARPRRRRQPTAPRAHPGRPAADLQPRLLHLGRAAGRAVRRVRRPSRPGFWPDLRAILPVWDELIDEFNARTRAAVPA